MVQRHENNIYFDDLDELALEQLDQPIPGSPITADEAVVYANSLRDTAIGVTDEAYRNHDATRPGSLNDFYKAGRIAEGLGTMRSRILSEVPNEELAYIASQVDTK